MRALLMLLIISVAQQAPPTGPSDNPDTSPGRPAEAPAAALPGDAEPVAPQITVKPIDPVKVVRLVHVGPYWTAGSKFAALRAYMLEHGQRGPMYARHLENPTSVPADSMRTEIGFYIDSDHEPKPPYETALRPEEEVAFVCVNGPLAAVSRQYAVLKEWATTHGYVPVGPITEIYPLSGEPCTDQPRVEVQMPIRTAEPKVTERQPATEMPQVTPPEARVAVRPPAKEIEQHITPTVDVPPIHDAGADQAPEPPLPDPPEPPSAEPVLPVRNLVDEGRFGRIAEQLLPDSGMLAPELQVWLGQVVFRIGAIAKGVERTYPDRGSRITSLAETLAWRYEQVSVDFKLDPLDQPVVRVNAHSDPHAAEERAIMRELDTIMGRISLRSIDAEATFDQLVSITQRVQDVVH